MGGFPLLLLAVGVTIAGAHQRDPRGTRHRLFCFAAGSMILIPVVVKNQFQCDHGFIPDHACVFKTQFEWNSQRNAMELDCEKACVGSSPREHY